MMLEKRKISFEYIELTHADDISGRELPFLEIDNETYVGKNALLKIRQLNTFTNPPETIKNP
jgi:hypothetical protein